MAAALTFHLTGGAAESDPNNSLGGTGSSVVISSTALNNLFDNISPTEITGSNRVEYRAIDIVNDGDALAENVEWYLTDTTNSESALHSWYDSAGTQSIANETTEPSEGSPSWTQPLVGSKEALGNLAAAATHRMWIRRTVDQDATNINDDTGTLNVWFS